MLLYSTIWKAFYWMAMGVLYTIMIAGAPSLADSLGLQMSWWKWLLTALWYVLLSLGVAASFTLMGEKEPRAGQYSLGLTLVIMIILGVGLWSLL